MTQCLIVHRCDRNETATEVPDDAAAGAAFVCPVFQAFAAMAGFMNVPGKSR
ncbi:protein of unknown function [Burkholderia multivorans]